MTRPARDEFERNRLEINARPFRYDPVLDPIADQMDAGDRAWLLQPLVLQSRASVYRDFRASYRAAVAAGAIPYDRGPHAA